MIRGADTYIVNGTDYAYIIDDVGLILGLCSCGLVLFFAVKRLIELYKRDYK